VSSRRPENFLYMSGMDLDVEKNKKNITKFQKIKWCRNSRWPAKIVSGLVCTTMHLFQNILPRLSLSIAELL
jgi:hypothetical protein